jgi:hypothetical protein
VFEEDRRVGFEAANASTNGTMPCVRKLSPRNVTKGAAMRSRQADGLRDAAGLELLDIVDLSAEASAVLASGTWSPVSGER